ncbi:MAG: hypothetical protein R2851_02395 [Caldilineaceae bacterium]
MDQVKVEDESVVALLPADGSTAVTVGADLETAANLKRTGGRPSPAPHRGRRPPPSVIAAPGAGAYIRGGIIGWPVQPKIPPRPWTRWTCRWRRPVAACRGHGIDGDFYIDGSTGAEVRGGRAPPSGGQRQSGRHPPVHPGPPARPPRPQMRPRSHPGATAKDAVCRSPAPSRPAAGGSFQQRCGRGRVLLSTGGGTLGNGAQADTSALRSVVGELPCSKFDSAGTSVVDPWRLHPHVQRRLWAALYRRPLHLQWHRSRWTRRRRCPAPSRRTRADADDLAGAVDDSAIAGCESAWPKQTTVLDGVAGHLLMDVSGPNFTYPDQSGANAGSRL